MNKNTMFICVSSNGQVFDRTLGKNVILARNVRYSLGNGTIIVNQNDEGQIELRRFNTNNNIAYSKVLELNSAYTITPLFVQMMPKASKNTRALFNALKELFGTKPVYKVDEDLELDRSYSIGLELKVTRVGIFEYKILVQVNPYILSSEQVKECFELVKEVSMLDLKSLFRNNNISQNNTICLSIDKEFVLSAMRNES